MKRKIWSIGILCLGGLALVAATAIAPTYFPGGVRIGPDRNFTQPYLLKLDNPSGTTVFSVDNQGRVNNDDVIVVDNINDFTNLVRGSVGSGTSVVRMLWGKRYIVDPHTVQASFVAAGVTATYSGTTLILPYATSSASNYQASSIEMRLTGTTGFDACKTGATPITVWAPLHPSCTSYNTSSVNVKALTTTQLLTGTTYQTVLVAFRNIALRSDTTGLTCYGSTNKLTSLTTGGSVWGINKPNESYVFEYVHGSGTSVIITGGNILDTNDE